MKIGLLGGSFDPVHLAHIALADSARKTLGLDEVRLIPAANPWQRAPLAADASHRLAMLELAVAGHPGLRIDPQELARNGPTYTADTLDALPEGHTYYWILGADQLANFCTWHRWQDIAQRVYLAVAQRPGTPLAEPDALRRFLDEIGRPLLRLSFAPRSISSTEIRRRLAHGGDTASLLDVAVAQYIRENQLYRAPDT